MKRFSALLCLALTPALTLAEEKFFDSKGVKIHFVEQGSGEAVVLVHGMGGSLETWLRAGVIENLARDHRVIAFDCRGHGMSGKPHDAKQYGREMALDIVRLLDHLKISKAHIVGYSLGAQLTSLLLTLHPERFQTATLGAGSGRIDWTGQDRQTSEKMASEIEKYGFSPTMRSRLSPPNTPPMTEEEIQKRSQAALAAPDNDRMVSAAVTRSQSDTVITSSKVAAVTVPTLGVVGSRDPLALGQLNNLKKIRPGINLVVIEGATHGTAMGRPEFLAAVREMITAHPMTGSRPQ